jgi:hypothetical protein
MSKVDKAFMILLSLVVVASFVVNLMAVIVPVPHPACDKSRVRAVEVATAGQNIIAEVMGAHDNNVYKNAVNINQQMFLTQEETEVLVGVVAQEISALIQLQAECE